MLYDTVPLCDTGSHCVNRGLGTALVEINYSGKPTTLPSNIYLSVLHHIFVISVQFHIIQSLPGELMKNFTVNDEVIFFHKF